MFGGVNVWRIAELKVIGEIKFGEWIDFGHKVLLPAKIWLVKVWRITHDLPNSPNFPTAKHSCYMVLGFSSERCVQQGLSHLLVSIWCLQLPLLHQNQNVMGMH